MIKEFYITEPNFEKESKKIRLFIDNKIKSGFKIYLTNQLPPCISHISKNDNNHIFEYNSHKLDYALFDSKSILVRHNILFSRERITQIKKYNSDMCLSCVFYKKRQCKGITNKLFQKEKSNIEKRLGVKTYNTIRCDYSNHKFDFGSICNANCEFCFNNNFPQHILKRIPFLSLGEINHFLYYLPNNFWFIGVSDHIQSGELLFHPQVKEIINLIGPRSNGCAWLATNCTLLDEPLIKQLGRSKIPLALSITSLNKTDIKLVSKFPEIPDYNKIIKSLSKQKIDFEIFIVPLKRNIENNAIEKFVQYILNKTTAKRVTFLPPSYNKYTPKKMIEQLKIRDTWILDYLFKLKSKYKKISWMGKELVNSKQFDEMIMIELKQQLSVLRSISGLKLILHSINVTKLIKKVVADLEIKQVLTEEVHPNTIGGNISCAGMLLVTDYDIAIKKFISLHKKPDVLILPSISFDNNLRDISLDSPLRLYDKYKIPLLIVKNFNQ